MSRRSSELAKMVPMLIVLGTIFFLSHQPADSISLPAFPGSDKIAHMMAYSFLGWSMLFSIPPRHWKRRGEKLVYSLVLFLVVLYGISDEFHQSFIPGRQPDLFDIVADMAGGIVAISSWMVWKCRYNFTQE